MDKVGLIEIEVAYARGPDEQLLVVVQVPAGITVREVLDRSGLADRFPEIDVLQCPIGVFGRLVNANHVPKAGDRIEVYRPLKRDPRETRRALAAGGIKVMGSSDSKG